MQQHFNIPASTVDEEFFTVGQLFDGSSIRGFANIHESDMQLIPDVSTGVPRPVPRRERTLIMVFDIYNPRNGEIYAKDPRQVAKKAEKYLASTGIADTAFFAPEAEFYIFDDVRYEVKQNSSFYSRRLRRGRLELAAATKRAATSATRPPTRAATSRSAPSTSRPTCATTSASS